VPLVGAGGFNPAALSSEGREARAAHDRARAAVARVLRAAPREIVFTSGGSESDVLAVVGAARAASARGRHVIGTAIEHHAVLHALDLLELAADHGLRSARMTTNGTPLTRTIARKLAARGLDRIQITFTPAFGANKQLSAQVATILKAGQWIDLINRISKIAEPSVPTTPSKYALPASVH